MLAGSGEEMQRSTAPFSAFAGFPGARPTLFASRPLPFESFLL